MKERGDEWFRNAAADRPQGGPELANCIYLLKLNFRNKHCWKNLY